MAHSTTHDAKIKSLEGRLNHLSDKLATFGSHAQQVNGLIPIIHAPGWTTPAEVMLISGVVEAMIKHTELVAELHTALVRGAQAIGKD